MGVCMTSLSEANKEFLSVIHLLHHCHGFFMMLSLFRLENVSNLTVISLNFQI